MTLTRTGLWQSLLNWFRKAFGLPVPWSPSQLCGTELVTRLLAELTAFRSKFKSFEFNERIESVLRESNETKVLSVEPILFYLDMPVWLSFLLKEQFSNHYSKQESLKDCLYNHFVSLDWKTLNQSTDFFEREYWTDKIGKFAEFQDNLERAFSEDFGDEDGFSNDARKLKKSIWTKLQRAFKTFDKFQKSLDDVLSQDSMLLVHVLVDRIVDLARNSNLNKNFPFVSSSGTVDIKKLSDILLIMGYQSEFDQTGHYIKFSIVSEQSSLII